MRIRRDWVLLASMLCSIALLVGTGVAMAAEPPQDPAPVATAAASPDGDGQVLVSAWLGDGESGEVSFYLEADFMGRSQVFLGSAVTDATGKAQVSYMPTWEGTQRVVARLAGGAETTIEFDVAGLGSVYAATAPVLSRVREWMPVMVGSVAVVVLSTLALVLLRTAFGILDTGRRWEAVARRYPAQAGVTATEHRQWRQS